VTAAERYRLLRSGYYRRLEVGIAVALGLHVVVFTLAPPYVPRPFRLRHDQPLRLVVTALPVMEPAPLPAQATAPVTPLPPAAVIRSEQLVTVPTRPATAAAALGPERVARGTETPGGVEGDVPAVFYAYDTAPRIVRRVEPEYPLAARATGAEGTVVIDVNVDQSGKIVRAWVARSTAPEILIEAALDAVYQFEFLPGKQGSFPVKCTVAIPIRFSLKSP
jgi:protein TonB